MFEFRIQSTDGLARAGTLTLPHGEVQTPAFMPVGTHAVVRGLSANDVRHTGAQIILGNTYHLHLRPGEGVIQQMGGLHRFTTWDRPMLTDSGGFQVFSLQGLRSIGEHGVEFQSHIDGTTRTLTPERAMEIQWQLGADIAMTFDHVVPGQSSPAAACEGMERTLRWLDRCRQKHSELLEEADRRTGGQAVEELDLPRYRPTALPPDIMADHSGRHPRRAAAPVARGHARARSLDRHRYRRPVCG